VLSQAQLQQQYDSKITILLAKMSIFKDLAIGRDLII
jgi:hypothetical protein